MLKEETVTDMKITRRDFLNGVLLGAGAVLLEFPAPMRLFAQERRWGDYGGTGDYSASNGNTEDVVRYAHAMRDGKYDVTSGKAIDIQETFDLVIVGGGISGLAAALQFRRVARPGQRCLVIENHPIFGGEAKRNEFIVDGLKLIGPQGSNSFIVIDDPDAPGYEIYSELGIPRSFTYQKLSADKKLRFDTTNFGFMLWHDSSPSFGYFFNGPGPAGRWAADIWDRQLENTPFSEKIRKDFFTWRNSRKRYYEGTDFGRWLDTMTYKQYMETVIKLDPSISKFVDPVLAASIGLGSDVISAYGAYQVAMPGFRGFPGGSSGYARTDDSDWHSFPGGNDGFSRHFIKRLIPDAIGGKNSFGDIMNQQINFGALDRPDSAIRLRLGSLAVRLAHNTDPEKSDHVLLDYVKGGTLYRAKARAVVMANGSWVTRRIVKDLPSEYKHAYSKFYRSPFLVVNVALTNWKFLYELGLTACRWFGGFGFSCNIRQPMIVGDYRPPLDPGKPTIITFYVPFYSPGLSMREQGNRGRRELLSTSYAEYENMILKQMTDLFGKSGFDPKKDVAGIILNRWGHAYVNPQPGFYFGADGMPAPRSIIRERFGRISFAHSELNGHQHWLGAAEEGRRAAKQVLGL
jgi:spermidine dehydrogenase